MDARTLLYKTDGTIDVLSTLRLRMQSLATAPCPCPICGQPMQRITAIRPGYTDKVWACPACQYHQRRGQ